MNLVRLAILLVGIVFILFPLNSQDPTGREIMEKYKEQELTNDESAEIHMKLIRSGGRVREREVRMISKTDEEENRKLLIRFLSPADVAGTGFLSIEYSDRDDDNWLYLPALRSVRRIASQDKTDSFVGTDFTYEDFDSEDLDAYDYTFVETETINDTETWKVEAIPTDPEKIEGTVYGKRELWVSKEHAVVVRAKHYDTDDVLIKELRSYDIRQVPGTETWRPYRMVMEDVESGNRTELELTDIEIDQGIPDDYFTQRYLQRGR